MYNTNLPNNSFIQEKKMTHFFRTYTVGTKLTTVKLAIKFACAQPPRKIPYIITDHPHDSQSPLLTTVHNLKHEVSTSMF